MTKYIDARGVTWDTAEEAMTDFCSDLPPLTEDQANRAFQHTDAFRDAEKNLAALKETIESDPELHAIFGYWPVPVPQEEGRPTTIADRILDRDLPDIIMRSRP
jgi:hypothetical protein